MRRIARDDASRALTFSFPGVLDQRCQRRGNLAAPRRVGNESIGTDGIPRDGNVNARDFDNVGASIAEHLAERIMGVDGAAVATTIGRTTGVIFALSRLIGGNGRVTVPLDQIRVKLALMGRLVVNSFDDLHARTADARKDRRLRRSIRHDRRSV